MLINFPDLRNTRRIAVRADTPPYTESIPECAARVEPRSPYGPRYLLGVPLGSERGW